MNGYSADCEAMGSLPIWTPRPEASTLAPIGHEGGLMYRFDYSNMQAKLKTAGSNLLSTLPNQQMVSTYIRGEVVLSRMAGPLPQKAAEWVHTSSIGVIPKSRTPGK